MRNVILKHLIVFIVLAVSGGFLMHTSHSVQRLEKEVRTNEKLMEQEEEAIRILKAEWAYLNTPERLEKMARHGLHMDVPETKKVISDPENLPVPPAQSEAINISYEGQQ